MVLAAVWAPCLASTSAETGRGGHGWSGRSTGQVGPALTVPNTPVPAGGDGEPVVGVGAEEVGGAEAPGAAVVGAPLVRPAVTMVEPAGVAPVADGADADVAGPAVPAGPPEAATREEDVGAAGPVDAERVATEREGPQAAPATGRAQASTIPGRAHRLRSTAAMVARRGAPACSGPHRWQAANPDASVRVRG